MKENKSWIQLAKYIFYRALAVLQEVNWGGGDRREKYADHAGKCTRT